jgi:hypothetical protein
MPFLFISYTLLFQAGLFEGCILEVTLGQPGDA